MIFSASATMECASALASLGRRLPRFRPFGQPPSFALRLAAADLRLEVTDPPSFPSATAAWFFSMPNNTQSLRSFHEKFQSSPLPNIGPGIQI